MRMATIIAIFAVLGCQSMERKAVPDGLEYLVLGADRETISKALGLSGEGDITKDGEYFKKELADPRFSYVVVRFYRGRLRSWRLRVRDENCNGDVLVSSEDEMDERLGCKGDRDSNLYGVASLWDHCFGGRVELRIDFLNIKIAEDEPPHCDMSLYAESLEAEGWNHQ